MSEPLSNDLTFFTNEPGAALQDRFIRTLPDAQFFDVLVGYFRTSGFYLLADALKDVEKIRILVGLNVDRTTFDVLETNRQLQLDFQNSQRIKQQFSDGVTTEMEHAADTHNTEVGVRSFLDFLQSGKLELKAHRSQNIHAKVYISRFYTEDRDYGRVITGSSNFSYSGLEGQYEFNVELKDRTDVKFALEKFEQLWLEAVDISTVYVDAIKQRTWLNDQILPYELYLKFLYEYFKEDINIDQEADFYLPDGFLDLFYQKQAVIAAKKVLNAYGGVFLADVVGLGKTYISALLAQQLPGRKLVICPPVLQAYWKETFVQFGVGAVWVESIGKLDHILERLRANPNLADIVFIDEAHRFRNERTQSYTKLHDICQNRKVVLVSATPLNNRISDIESQLKLFQTPRKSDIPGVRNLDAFFKELNKELEQEERGTPEYAAAFKNVAGQVRSKILHFVMVRRTRNEIRNFFQEDLVQQGISFPTVVPPQRVVYTFEGELDHVFSQTIEYLATFRYARYTPLLFLKKKLTDFEAQGQRNVGGFMKSILVKRLESSFFAFRKTLTRFIQSYDLFIHMMDEGTVLIGKGLKIEELLDEDNEEHLLDLIEKEKVQRYKASDFEPELYQNLLHDRQTLEQIQTLWENLDQPAPPDPKFDAFLDQLQTNPLLRQQKLIVFTESTETGRYLFDRLSEHYPEQVLFYSSKGGVYNGQSINKNTARALIEANYDPRYAEPEQDLQILITTDVLAEGINLHRSNIVVNYDLPWNPTRVLQRVGRVNRIGTSHDQVHIVNFFPTSQSDEHLGLEENIKTKIQAFHDMLGEDAKYLTEEEDITQHELFGSQLYSRITQAESYEGTDEAERSELEYLQIIRHVRDNDPTLFEKIKRLPKKARSGRALQTAVPISDSNVLIQTDQLISFFRRGLLKKFYLNAHQAIDSSIGDFPIELSFLEAVDRLECDQATPRRAVPKSYYDLLDQNKIAFADATSPEAEEMRTTPTNRGNVGRLIKYLSVFRNQKKGYTEDDDLFFNYVLQSLRDGAVPTKRVQELYKELGINTHQAIIDPLKILSILRQHINQQPTATTNTASQAPDEKPLEVILSAYLAVESTE